MYIVNPTDEQKVQWYHCGYRGGLYLCRTFGLSPIATDDKFYYFVKTDEFKEIFSKISFLKKKFYLL